MGSERLLPRGSAGARGLGRRILDRSTSRDRVRVPALRESDRPRHRGGASARPQRTTRTPIPSCSSPGRSCSTRLPAQSRCDDYHNWWAWVPGADWRHPEGPESTVGGRERHPVTHVAHADATAYADWAGKSLPTEAEWEYAARGGLDGAIFTWGDEFAPKGRMMANTWQGEFPWQNLLLDRYERTSPVETYPPNGYGLYDMAGNVWEWTDGWFAQPSGKRRRIMLRTAGTASGRRALPSQGDQGRLAPVRAELLPALSPRRPPG